MIIEQVAWCSEAEWLHIHSILQTDRSTVLRQLQLWEHRMGPELPVAIVATLAALTGLEEIQLNRDKQGTMFCASGALVQAVGVITERYREANLPIHILAAEIGIPDWVTNLRHQIAHGPCQSSIETLEDALEAVYEALTTNSKSYWVLQKEDYEKQKDEANHKISMEEQNALNTLARQIVESDMDHKIVISAMEIACEEKYLPSLSEALARRYSSFPRIPNNIWLRGFRQIKITNVLVFDLLRIFKLLDDTGRKPDKKIKEWIYSLLGDCRDANSEWLKDVMGIISEKLDSSSGGFIKLLEKLVEASNFLDQKEKAFFLKKLLAIKRVFNAMSNQQTINIFTKNKSSNEVKEERRKPWSYADHSIQDTKERVFEQLCQFNKYT